MARAVVVATLTLLSVFVWPQRSEAAELWAWIKALSGPGPFRGTQIDVRLACLGAVKKEADPLQWVRDASERSEKLFAPYRAAQNLKISDDLNKKVTALNATLREITEVTSDEELRLAAADAESLSDSLMPSGYKEAAALYRGVANNLRMERVRRGTYGISTGVLFSACTGERSTAPLTLGVSYRALTYTDPTGEYAGGNEMGLTTFGVAAMWRPINGVEHRKSDWVDIGVAVSRYWFTNRGSKPGSFSHFSGLMLEPFRVEIHAPSAVRNHPSFWWASIPFVQFTGVVFPGGFPPNAFGPNLVGPKAERLPAEWTWGGNVFFDLTPVVERLARRGRH